LRDLYLIYIETKQQQYIYIYTLEYVYTGLQVF